MTTSAPVVLFDGRCNLCNRTVQLILDYERAPELRFAALQSVVARHLVERVFDDDEAKLLLGGAAGDGAPDSIVLIDGDRGLTRSAAALRIARYLRAPYRWLSWLVIVPRPLRDFVYRWIGQRRYRWFGASPTCRIPTPELRARFLS